MSAFRNGGDKEGEEWELNEFEREDAPLPGEEEQLRDLTAEFLRADPKASGTEVIGRLFLAYFQRFVKLFGRRANDRRHAEDAIQKAFEALQVYYNKNNKLPDEPVQYLFIAARNWLVNKAKQEDVRHDVSLTSLKPATLDGFLDKRAAAREPFEEVASKEIRETADKVLKGLDETSRQIIALRRQGKEFEEIARNLGISSGELARQKFNHAEHQVKAAWGAKFSSFATTAEAEIRRSINCRKSAEKAIDLIAPPYNKVLHLLLVIKLTEKEVAAHLGSSPEEIRRHHTHAVELFQKQFHMTEDELLDAIWHSGR